MALEMDIGTFLFRDVLRMYDYPGAPFSGMIVNDIILYFFIPMVFVIFFIYMLLGRIVVGVIWLRLLMGLAIFLFMIVNGWFAMFAYMAGPYFVFLIIVLGALYFIPSHFRIGGGGGRPTDFPGGGERVDRTYFAEKAHLESELKRLRQLLEEARNAQSKDEARVYAQQIEGIRTRLEQLQLRHRTWERYVPR
jgi:hypothetical protein